jgi:hypothetical protein
VDCGRKKLPFAGYSVVKERSSKLQPCGCGRSACALPGHGVTASLQTLLARSTPALHSYCRAPCHSPELLILTSPGGDCKQNRRIFLTCYRPSVRSGHLHSCPRSTAEAGEQNLASAAQSLLPRPFPGWLANRSFVQLRPRPDGRRAKAGGEYRARTGDLLVANQALSQLS